MRVLVTGAAAGIGAATAHRFAADGADVVALDAVAGGDLPNLRRIVADVTKPDQVARAVETAAGDDGLDVCVANAGVSLMEPFLAGAPDSWERVLRVNLLGVMITLQAAARSMVETGRPGRLLATASIAGLHGEPGSAAYCASKAAVIGLVRTLAVELAPHRITVNAVDAALDNTLVCPFNDLAGVEAAFAREPEAVAAVIVEPIAHNAGSIAPAEGFLGGLRELCDRQGALLIFDEVITGFRHHLGGYQAIAGVSPDLTTLAKALGNGFPIAAIAGRRDHMERFSTGDRGDVWFAGTCNGNVPGVAAALAGIAVLEQEDVHGHLFRLGDRMRRGLAEIAARASVPAAVNGFGSVFCLCFLEGPVTSYEDVLRNDVELFVAYRRELAKRGVFEMPENLGRSHLMYSHTDADVDHTLEAAEHALRAALDSDL